MSPRPALPRLFLSLGALNMALAVGLNAYGMHGLKANLAANDPLGWFQTALQYHQLHALGLLAIGLATLHAPVNRWLDGAGLLFLAGMVLFSGNLYLRSIAGIHVFHAVTPIGGMAFIAGWMMFAWGIWRAHRSGST